MKKTLDQEHNTNSGSSMTELPEISQLLTNSNRIEHKDKAVPGDITYSNWSNLQLIRLVAIGRRFTRVDFANTAFDNCYLRDCQFDSCNFTGSKFTSTNLHGAKFTGCNFDYATFERTLINDDILNDNCPVYDNLKMRFARSLRTNYQQIGDAAAANRAIRVELDATEIHLRKTWKSNDRYYRTKYPGLLNRTKQFIFWAQFRLLDYIWGNGESISAFLRTIVLFMLAVFAIDLSMQPSPSSSPDIFETVWRAPQIFFGVTSPNYISSGWLTTIAIVRLITFGLFMSILVKRFNRR